MHTQQRHGRRWFQAPMSLRRANSCPDFDMEVKIWTALGIVGAQSVRRRRMITPKSPTAACGGNVQMKKSNRSIYAEYWWNYKIIAKHYAERSRSFGGCVASRTAGVDAYP